MDDLKKSSEQVPETPERGRLEIFIGLGLVSLIPIYVLFAGWQ
jgi:hypothetical protein